MRLAISSDGGDLSAPVNPNFGRCPKFLFVESETMALETVDNPGNLAGGGAGIQAAQFVIGRGAEAVLTGNVGPNAYQVFQAAGVPVFQVADMTAVEAVAAWRAGRLQSIAGATVTAHAGMRRSMQRGGTSSPAATQLPGTTERDAARQQEIAALQQTAMDLRQQMVDVMARIAQLEETE